MEKQNTIQGHVTEGKEWMGDAGPSLLQTDHCIVVANNIDILISIRQHTMIDKTMKNNLFAELSYH